MTDENGVVTAISTTFHCGYDEILVELPDTIDLTEENRQLVINGSFTDEDGQIFPLIAAAALPDEQSIEPNDIEQALVEIAEITAQNAQRLDEQDAALIELAAMIAGGA